RSKRDRRAGQGAKERSWPPPRAHSARTRDRPRGAREWYTTWMQTYEGGCHCGAVRFRVTAELDRVTECNCSMCSKKGFLHLIIPRDRFELLRGADTLTTYQFGTQVAKHHFCRTCGIHSYYIPRSDPDKVDVNVRCLDGIDVRKLDVKGF